MTSPFETLPRRNSARRAGAAFASHRFIFYFDTQYSATTIFSCFTTPKSCWVAIAHIIATSEQCSHDRQRLAEGRPLSVGPRKRQGCRPIHDRGFVRPCAGLKVTRFLALHIPHRAVLPPIMTPEAWQVATTTVLHHHRNLGEPPSITTMTIDNMTFTVVIIIPSHRRLLLGFAFSQRHMHQCQ
jgi:hypothetical protein